MSLRQRTTPTQERVDQVNQITNGFGQTLLTICNGDWDLALSVSLSLFASTCAQAAVNHDESAEALFEEMGEPARKAVLTFEAEFKSAEGEDDD